MCVDYCPFSQKLGEHPVTVTCPTGGHQVIIEKGGLLVLSIIIIIIM